MKMGDFFKNKFGIDPSGLTLTEIDRIVFNENKNNVSLESSSFVSIRDIFPPKNYDEKTN